MTFKIDTKYFKEMLKSEYYQKYPEEMPNAVMTIRNENDEVIKVKFI